MRSTTLSQLRLLLVVILLLGHRLDSRSGGGIGRVMAQEDDLPEAGEEANNNKQDKEDEKKDKEDDKLDIEEEEDVVVTTAPTLPPSTLGPTLPPTVRPTAPPTLALMTEAVTTTPASDPALSEAALPEIVIDLQTESGMTMGTCDSFFHDFVQNLLTASRVISPSSLNSTSLDISLESLSATDGDGNKVESSSSTTEFSKGADSSSVRILVDGMVYYYPITNNVADTPEQDYNLKESISHSMMVYLTLWGTGDLEKDLEQCGMSSPQVIAVHVDGTPVELPKYDEDDAGYDSDSNPVEITAEASDPDTATTTSTQVMVSTCLLGGVVLLALFA